MTLEVMRVRRQEIAERLKTLEDRIETEKRDYIEEEETEINGLLDEADDLEKKIQREERKQKFQQKMEKTETIVPEVQPEGEERQFAMAITQGGPRRSDPNRFYSSLGEQLIDIVYAGMGVRTDPRLHEVRAATGLGEAQGDIGGFL